MLSRKLTFLFFIGLLVACSSSKKSKGNTSMSPGSTQNLSGPDIIAKSDCLVCHRLDEKLVAPSYRDIATRYEASAENISNLADKIIQGGPGSWGQTPMTPHPSLSKDEAIVVVKYILSLKNK